MKAIRSGLAALALFVAVASAPPVFAQAMSQTYPQTGTFNGQRYASVTYTITADNTYMITMHFENGDQFTQTVSSASLFFSALARARLSTGSGLNN